MKSIRLLVIVSLFMFLLPGMACSRLRAPAQPPPSEQITTPSPIPATSPAPASPTPTSLPSPTEAPLPSPTLLTPPTPTPVPFLPRHLVAIRPENTHELSQVAELPAEGATVVTFSPDGSRVAVGTSRTNQVIIWDLTSGQELFSLSGHDDPRIISYLAFSPDGTRLASGAQGWDAPNDSLIIWDASTGRELSRFSGMLGAISPDWSLVALTQRERNQGVTLILSDLASGEELHALQAPSDIYGISFSPDGQQVAAKMYHVFQDLFSFWSVDSGRLDRTLYDWLGFSYSPDGRFIAALLNTASGDDQGELNIFDAASFKWIKTLAKDADSLWYTFPAFSADGQILAGSTGDQLTLWDTASWQVLAPLPVSGPAGLVFSPDGRLLTTYTLSGAVQLWGVEEGP